MVAHPFFPKFVYSDGVQECFEAGCYWLNDIVATEVRPLVSPGKNGIFRVVVDAGRKAELAFHGYPVEPLWRRSIELTDMPEGTWDFLLESDGRVVFMILPNEY